MRFPSFDLYKEIGVSPEASNDEIKKAHRQLVKRYHPDINKNPGAEERFKRISVAYEVLSNSEKRTVYNSTLISRRTTYTNPAPSAHTYTRTRTTTSSPVLDEIGDLFRQFYRTTYGESWREEMKNGGMDPDNPFETTPRTSPYSRGKAPSNTRYYKYPRYLDYGNMIVYAIWAASAFLIILVVFRMIIGG